MIENELAARYGRALFQLALEKEKLEVFRDNLDTIEDLMSENVDFEKVMLHQKISPAEKKQVIKKILSGQLDQYIINFLFLLIDKHRVFIIKKIIKQYTRLLNEDRRVLEVEVLSAIEMSENMQDKLRAKLDGLLDYEIILNNKCDPGLIGGLKLKIRDQVIDGSLKNGLESMKNRIKRIPVSELGVEL